MDFKQKIIKFLRWSQKYTKTDMVYLTVGGFWLILGQIISIITSLLLFLAFANLLPKEIYGTYQYVLSLAGILAIPTLSGMNTAIIRAVAQGYEGSFVPALKTKLRWGVLGSLASLVVAGYYFLNNSVTLTICFLIAAIFIPLMNSFLIYQSFWNGKKRFDVQTKNNIIIRIFAVASLIITLFLTKNIFLILLVYFIVYTLLYFIFLQIVLKKINLNTKYDPKIISYGKHLSLINVIGAIAGQLDKILLWHFLGATGVAIYSFAYSPIIQLQGLFGKTLGPLALPKFSEKSIDELKSALPKKIAKIFLIMLIGTVSYIILIPWIYRIFLPQYLESINYARVLSLILLCAPLMFLGTFLEAHAKIKEIYIYKSISNISYIVSLIVLSMLFKIWGVVFAALFFCLIDSILIIIIFKRAK